jgi:hypothetical protein
VFWEEDAALILSIPTRPDHEDFVAWHFDPKGKFSVKSAYHVLDEERGEVRQASESSSSSSKADDQLFWKKILRLNVCPKAKQFIWRVAHNSLVTKMNIKRRGMKLDTRCPVCWRFDVNGGHCFLKCKAVRCCWMDLHLEDTQTLLTQACSAKDFVNDILKCW